MRSYLVSKPAAPSTPSYRDSSYNTEQRKAVQSYPAASQYQVLHQLDIVSNVTLVQAPPPPSRPAPDPPSYAAVTSYSRPDYSAPASSYLQDTKPEYGSVGQPTQYESKYEPRYGSKVPRLTTMVFVHFCSTRPEIKQLYHVCTGGPGPLPPGLPCQSPGL